jgi:O-antigen ligase
MLFQLVPLPPHVVALISPNRWNNASAARSATGFALESWLPLSVAPAATLERLLYVVPAMATFAAVRELGRSWGTRHLWVIVAPVIGVALIESWLGLGQFSAGQADPTDPQLVRGTYVNRNHFAGLLELALPLAIMWAIAIWHKAKEREERVSANAAIRASVLLVAAAFLLAMVIASLSRMGFVASLFAIVVVALGWMFVRTRSVQAKIPKWAWFIPLALPVGIFALFSTNAMVFRFADTPGLREVNSDGRMQIWIETVRLISAYKWSGTGLGAFEQGLFPWRHFAPDFTFDFAHNDYLQVTAELGVVGGLSALALGVWILWRPISVVLKSDSKHRALALGLIGALLGIALHSLVDFNLYIPSNALAVAWLAGLAVSPGLEQTA